MRQPDINRVKRAMEHIMAAITNINSIKWENRNSKEDAVLETTKGNLAEEYRVLRLLSERKDEEQPPPPTRSIERWSVRGGF